MSFAFRQAAALTATPNASLLVSFRCRPTRFLRQCHEDDDASQDRTAVKNLEKLFDLYNGTTEYNEAKFYAAYEAVFDEQVAALHHPIGSFCCLDQIRSPAKSLVEMNFYELYVSIFRAFGKLRLPIKILSIRLRADENKGCGGGGWLQYSIALDYYSGHVLVLDASAKTTRTGKIIYLQHDKATFPVEQGLQHLYGLLQQGSLASDHDRWQQDMTNAFDNVFDRNVLGLTFPLDATHLDAYHDDLGNYLNNRRTLLDYNGLLDSHIAVGSLSTKPFITTQGLESIKVLPHGIIQYSTKMVDDKGDSLIVNTMAQTIHGKIVRLEVCEGDYSFLNIIQPSRC